MDSSTAQMLAVAPLPEGYKIRIPPDAFVAFLFAFILFVAIPGAFRIFFRLYFSRRLYLDDWLLIFAVACLSPAAALTHSVQDMMSLQLNVSAGRQDPPADFNYQMATFEKRLQIASALVWTALYTIKFTFLLFFHQFTCTTKWLHIYWWVVVGLCTICAGVSIPLGFMVCAHYTPEDYFEFCPVASQMVRERIYLIVTTILDVVTDVGVIIIPALLLWPLKLPLLRKMAVWGMMSLSTFMVVIAIVRAAGAALPNKVIDIAWLCFWQGMESAVAVLMVSLLVLKSMFGTNKVRRSDLRQRLDVEKSGPSSSSECLYSLQGKTYIRDGHSSISEPKPIPQWDYTDTFAPPPVPPKSAELPASRDSLPPSRPSPPPPVSRRSEAGSIPMVFVVPNSPSSSSLVSPPTATALAAVRSPVSPITPPPNYRPKPPPLVIPSVGKQVQIPGVYYASRA